MKQFLSDTLSVRPLISPSPYLPTGAYYTWKGTALEGSPIEPDVVSEFDWQDRRRGNDRQLATALKTVNAGISM
jgi:C-terminal processing protease CtpA/Prc